MLSRVKRSVLHTCHGHAVVGVGMRGAAAFCDWKCMYVSHWFTDCLIVALILGQKT